jgi:hypothetical protein
MCAQVGAQCSSVVICRSSPSQKAAIVRMMSEYEMRQVRGGGPPQLGMLTLAFLPLNLLS